MNEPKSLFRICAEFAATKFDKVFLEDTTQVENKKYKMKQGILLPCSVFQRILQASRDTHSLIPLPYLIPCLKSPSSIGYNNLNLENYKHENFTDQMIKYFLHGLQPNLISIRSYFLTDKFVVTLTNSSSNLTNLDLELDCRKFGTNYNHNNLMCPNLKKLNLWCLNHIHSNDDIDLFTKLNISLPKRELESLHYNNCCFSDEFVIMLRKFKDLKDLSLNSCRPLNFSILKDVILHQQKLRSLDLSYLEFKPISDDKVELYMHELLNGLPNLTDLDVSGTKLIIYNTTRISTWLSIRRLSYLGIFDCPSVIYEMINHDNIRADQIASECCTEHMVTAIERQYRRVHNLLKIFIKMLHENIEIHLKRIFKALLDILYFTGVDMFTDIASIRFWHKIYVGLQNKEYHLKCERILVKVYSAKTYCCTGHYALSMCTSGGVFRPPQDGICFVVSSFVSHNIDELTNGLRGWQDVAR